MREYNSNIDGKALKRAYEKRGYEGSEMSEMMGRSESYIANIVHTGVCPTHAIKTIEAMFNIAPEEYVIEAREKAKCTGTFDVDTLVEEQKVTNGYLLQIAETLEDLRYTMNILAYDLKVVKHELVPDESERTYIEEGVD